MINTGERQAGRSISEIAPNHKNRYIYARNLAEGSVLDIACGGGYGSYILAESNRITNIDAVDVSREAIEHAYKYFNNEKIRYVESDMIEFLNYSGEYDWIISFETIEHIEASFEALCLFREKSNNLILSVPNQDVLPFSKETHPFHVRHFTYQELSDMMNDAGWIITETLTQYDKNPGVLKKASDGQFFVVVAEGVM